jgi:hypothetical protein
VILGYLTPPPYRHFHKVPLVGKGSEPSDGKFWARRWQEGCVMTSLGLVIAVTAFLSGAATATFTMLIVGIRKGAAPWRPRSTCTAPLDAFTRSTLRTGNWPNVPVAFGSDEDH